MVKHSNDPLHRNYEYDQNDPARKLGEGANGYVTLAVHKESRRQFALKLIRYSGPAETHKEFIKEVELVRRLDHPNIVRLYEVHEGRQQLTILMELCGHGNVRDALRKQPHQRFAEADAARFGAQILKAVAHCHERGICHRDIALGNLLLDSHDLQDAHIKLIDFGKACFFREADVERYQGGDASGNLAREMSRCVGTLYSCAPEVFTKGEYTELIDVWSMGVVIYIMLSGRPPFSGMRIKGAPQSAERETLKAAIIAGRYQLSGEPWDTMSGSAIDIVRSLLVVEPSLRLSAAQALPHPFVALGTSSASGASDAAAMTTITSAMADMPQRTRLGQTSLMAVAFEITPTQATELRKAFIEIDKDHSGVLSKDEFARALRTSLGGRVTDEDIQSSFTAIDQDGNGTIQYLEFLAATQQTLVEPVSEEEFAAAFARMDVDENGTISAADLSTILGENHARHNSEELASMIQEVDLDGDGAVSYGEWRIALSMSPHELRELKEAFTLVDKDESGTLTLDEFSSVMQRTVHKITEEQVELLFNDVDTDGSGSIQYMEFITHCHHHHGARTIQCAARGKLARERVGGLRKVKAAMRIQCMIRQRIAHRKVVTQRRIKAAVRIQCIARIRIARRKSDRRRHCATSGMSREITPQRLPPLQQHETETVAAEPDPGKLVAGVRRVFPE